MNKIYLPKTYLNSYKEKKIFNNLTEEMKQIKKIKMIEFHS